MTRRKRGEPDGDDVQHLEVDHHPTLHTLTMGLGLIAADLLRTWLPERVDADGGEALAKQQVDRMGATGALATYTPSDDHDPGGLLDAVRTHLDELQLAYPTLLGSAGLDGDGQLTVSATLEVPLPGSPLWGQLEDMDLALLPGEIDALSQEICREVLDGRVNPSMVVEVLIPPAVDANATRLIVVVEEGYDAYWLARAMELAGYRPHLTPLLREGTSGLLSVAAIPPEGADDDEER